MRKADDFPSTDSSAVIHSLSKSDKTDRLNLKTTLVAGRQVRTENYFVGYGFLFALAFFFLVHTDFSFAANINGSMQKAGEFYRNGDYERAIEIYEDLKNNGYTGTSLYYNLANSYYRIGKLGYAILNYERALKLSPADEDVKHNLTFANLSTVDRIQPLPSFFLFEWWESLIASLSINGWTFLAFFIYLVLISLVVFYFFAKTISQQKSILFSGFGALVILAIIVSLLIVKINREETDIDAVIIAQSITVKTSPDSKSTDAFVIHEGLKVNLEDKLDEWVKIRLADGKVGWIEYESVKEI
jgi:tetratricopeptide (TPR) repeat protein